MTAKTKSVLMISDTHGNLPNYKNLAKDGFVDFICFAGDIENNYIRNFTPGIKSGPVFEPTFWGGYWNFRKIDKEKEAKEQKRWVKNVLLPWIEKIPHGKVLYVNGNHTFADLSEYFEYYAKNETRNYEIEGIKFSLIPGVSHLIGEWEDEIVDYQFKERILKADKEADVILTHTCPYGILDDPNDGLHIGFQSFTEAVLGGSFGSFPPYFNKANTIIFGHNHGRSGEQYETEIEGRKITFYNTACSTKRITIEIKGE